MDNRRKWSHEMNVELIKCWLLSQPDTRGFRKRLFSKWHERNPDKEMSESKLAGQVYALQRRGEFSAVEIEGFKRELNLLPVVLEASPPESPPPAPTLNSSREEIPVETPFDADTSESDPIRQTLLHDMVIDFESRTRLPKLNTVNRMKLSQLVEEVNDVLSGIPTSSLEDTNRLVYAAAKFICESVGPKKYSSAVQTTPPWKIRLSKKLSLLRKQLSQLVALSEGHLHNQRTISVLSRKFGITETNIGIEIEVLRQKVTAIAHKIRRYDNRNLQYHQNQLFRTNPKQVFNSRTADTDVPESDEALGFWKALWEKNNVHNGNAEWIHTVATELHSLTRQSNLHISLVNVQNSLK